MSLVSNQVSSLRHQLQRVQTQLYDVQAQKDRLQYEMDRIHVKHGTYQIICHLRNEIQRLTISKLLLIQSTALEMDRLRTIISLLSKNKPLTDLSPNTTCNNTQTKILTALLPPSTPTSPPPHFSWKETFNIDLNEEDLDFTEDNKLDVEDDIKIPEMNLDNLEDGAMKPISLLHRQSSSDIEDEYDSNDDNESNDENGYVIERVASPEHGDIDDSDDDNQNNMNIAIAQKKSLFNDNYDNMNSDHATDDNEAEPDDDIQAISNHPSHDASPQLQFAGDGIDLNQIHGIATNSNILPPSTEDGDIYGEEDHKFVIAIQNAENVQDDRKLDLVDVDDDELNDTHALISPSIVSDKPKNNILLQQNDDMENLELISEMGDDDRNKSPSPIEKDARIKIEVDEISDIDDNITPTTPDQTYNINNASSDSDDDDDIEDDDFEYDENSLMVSTPKSRLRKSHMYDVSTELFNNLSLEKVNSDRDSDPYKPRKPLRPRDTHTVRQRSLSLSSQNVTLLKGLRMGEMDVHIEICELTDLIDLISLICRAMTLLPFGLMEFRNKLENILQKRMCNSYALTQHFTFFLNSYRDCFAVSRLFGHNICMESIIELQRLNTFVVRPTGGHVKTPSNTKYVKNSNITFDHIEQDDEKTNLNRMLSPVINQNEHIIEYSGSNVVEFFRLPLVYPYVNYEFMATKCQELICPITNKTNVERLEIRKIYKSHAKPLLVDCYLKYKSTPISSFILKFGDDLRRDAAVLTMFKFMNNLWKDNKCIYNQKQIAALTYKCYPLGPDYGIIELIPNCQTLKDITDKYVKHKNKNMIADDVMNNIVATCAGSFMAAYIMGIRDRHFDNILVNDEGTIFHIDFGYMLGEKVSGIDTSKIAITGDLAKLMGDKWNPFVEISVQCWVILRENHQELLDFAKVAFSFLYPAEVVQEFLKETLMLHLSVEDGRNKINKRLLQAPKKLKTKLKNFVHSVATHSSSKKNNDGGRSPSPSVQSNSKRETSPFTNNKKDNNNNGFFSSFLSPSKRKSVTD